MNFKTSFIVLLSLAPLSIAWSAEQVSDPTMPANYNTNRSVNASSPTLLPEQYEWVLNSTIISPHLKLAIINGRQLKIGEEINGAILRHIGHQEVTLDYQDQIITLLLHRSFISQIKSDSSRN